MVNGLLKTSFMPFSHHQPKKARPEGGAYRARYN